MTHQSEVSTSILLSCDMYNCYVQLFIFTQIKLVCSFRSRSFFGGFELNERSNNPDKNSSTRYRSEPQLFIIVIIIIIVFIIIIIIIIIYNYLFSDDKNQ